MLGLVAHAAPCARLCLAPVATVGMDQDERAAVEASLVRALDAPRCADAITIDDQCFMSDACLKARAASFVVVRAVRAGPELRLNYAAVQNDRVRRGEKVAAAIPFYASGTLDHAIAGDACAPLAGEPASDTPSLPLIGIVGGASLAGVAALGLGISAIGLESRATDGRLKEAAFF
ncbi:MAG TPA: hypothetical protein VGO62_19205, partial [Myxococcota bacterium]